MFIALASIVVTFVIFLYIIILVWDKYSNRNYVDEIPTRNKCRTCENYNFGVDRCRLNKNPSTCCRWEHIDDDYYLGVADD